MKIRCWVLWVHLWQLFLRPSPGTSLHLETFFFTLYKFVTSSNTYNLILCSLSTQITSDRNSTTSFEWENVCFCVNIYLYFLRKWGRKSIGWILLNEKNVWNLIKNACLEFPKKCLSRSSKYTYMHKICLESFRSISVQCQGEGLNSFLKSFPTLKFSVLIEH